MVNVKLIIDFNKPVNPTREGTRPFDLRAHQT